VNVTVPGVARVGDPCPVGVAAGVGDGGSETGARSCLPSFYPCPGTVHSSLPLATVGQGN